MSKFIPKRSFLWGAATSSHQIEGNNTKNDWWSWESLGNIEGGVKSGAATDHWNRFKEDLQLAADLGLNSYRFSIEWSRLEPEEGHYDLAAFEWYSQLIDECERLKLLPMLTLHHFTSPQWFAEQGGFLNPKSPLQFEKIVKKIAEILGSRIPLWCTFNEPMVLVVGTYLGKFMPPGRFSPADASLSCYHLLRAHVLAYQVLHSEIKERKGPWKDHPLMVGIAHNMLDFQPDRRWNPIESLLTLTFHRFYNQSWLDAITGRKQHFGILGLVPYAKQVTEALGKPTVDFIGLNYYTKAYVQWRPRDANPDLPAELPIGLAFARRKEPASDLDWAIHPHGLGKMLRFAAGYQLPIYITENGIADKTDQIRPDYLRAHVKEVAKAIKDKIDVRGYYYWSLLDNFEWIKGFWPRFGLYQVNYDTFERTLTQSGKLYQSIIFENQNIEKSGGTTVKG